MLSIVLEKGKFIGLQIYHLRSDWFIINYNMIDLHAHDDSCNYHKRKNIVGRLVDKSVSFKPFHYMNINKHSEEKYSRTPRLHFSRKAKEKV